VAQATGADPDALGRIIRFLASLGVFQTDGETVTVTDLGRTLADGPPDSVRGLARYWMKTHYAPFGDLLHTARTGEIAAAKHLGRPFFEWISESPRLAEIQNTAMADGGRWARGDLLAAYKLPGNGTVADIGGADGTLLAEFLAGAPERRGIESRWYDDAPELELRDAGGSPVAEADLIAVSDGILIIAEAKSNNTLGSNPREIKRAAAKRVKLADVLRADQIILATTQQDWNASSATAMRDAVNGHPWAAGLPPSVRLVTGLGGDQVQDLRFDLASGTTVKWC
jgi:hypothetical protein